MCEAKPARRAARAVKSVRQSTAKNHMLGGCSSIMCLARYKEEGCVRPDQAALARRGGSVSPQAWKGMPVQRHMATTGDAVAQAQRVRVVGRVDWRVQRP